MASEGPTTWMNISEQCDLCDDSTLFRCCQCHLKLCNSCAKEHHLQEATHEINPYETNNDETKNDTSVPCKLHENRMCELYCQDCEVPVCEQCITFGHHGYHDLKNINDLLLEKKKILKTDTRDMQNMLETELMNIRKRVEVLAETSSSKYEDLEEIVVRHGKKWHDAVEKVVKTFVSDIQRMKNGETDTLNQLTQEIVNLICNAENNVKSNKETLQAFDAEKILNYKAKAGGIRSKIPEINVPNPMFTEFEVTESKIVHENFGVLKAKVMSVDDERRKSRELVKTYLDHQATHKLMEELTELSTIETGLSAVYSLTCKENGDLWVHGTDNSIVRIDRRNKKLERIKTTSFDGNVGIAMNHEGELVYTDVEDRSVNILKKSQMHALIRLSGWKPRDVCVTLEGDLLVSMSSDDDSRAKLVKYRGTKAYQEYYHDHRGRPLFPSGDTALHVAENKNWDICVAVTAARVVLVVNGMGVVRFKYSDRSGKKEFCPMGIATDSQCHILVTDYFNSRVQVLDRNGNLLRNIEGHGIYLPLSVCVCSYDTIYIGDSTGNIKQIKHLN